MEEVAAKCGELMPWWRDLSSVWTLPVLHALGAGKTLRFNQIKQLAHNVSATSLTERLRTFERRGFVKRRAYPEIPPRVEYSLTKRGRELLGVLQELTELAIKWEAEEAAGLGAEREALVRGVS